MSTIAKKLISLTLMLTLALSLLPAAAPVVAGYAAGAMGEFYVAPAPFGDDANDGSPEAPFATIEKARDEIRQIGAVWTGDVFVYIMGGDYYLADTLVFDERDSGKDGFRVVYANYPGETPVINGGQAVAGWVDAGGGIWKAPIGDTVFHTLYEDNVRALKARYPNAGPDNSPNYSKVAAKYIDELNNPLNSQNFRFNTGDIPVFGDFDDLTMLIWPGGEGGFWAWHNETKIITGIDYEERVVSFAGGTGYALGAGSRYFMQGKLEMLDAPGEFYIDTAEDYLYYMPRDEANLAAGKVVAPTMQTLLAVMGSSESQFVENITFEGLTFTNTDSTQLRSDAQPMVIIENAEYITIQFSKVQNSGGQGILLNNYAQNNTVYGNEVQHTGGGGIILQGETTVNVPGEGSRWTEKYHNKNNTVMNNHVHHIGENWVTGTAGVYISQSGENIVSGNRIHHSPRWGIALGDAGVIDAARGQITTGGTVIDLENMKSFIFSRDNLISFNDISDCNTDSQDTGLIYGFGQGTGNIIDHNFLHDSSIQFSSGTGMYLDNASHEHILTNNVIAGLQKDNDILEGDLGATFSVTGRGNIIDNNIMADNPYTTDAIMWWNADKVDGSGGNEVTRNILYNSGDKIFYMRPWDAENISVCDYNVYYNPNGEYGYVSIPAVDFEDWRTLEGFKYDQRGVVADPNFVNSFEYDYRVKPDSPALARGFNQINMKDIGLAVDFPFNDLSDPVARVYVNAGAENTAFRMSAGDAQQLEVTARTIMGFYADMNAAEVSFASNDPSVATVDNSGIVAAAGPGKTIVTATVAYGGAIVSADFYIIVDEELAGLEFLGTKPALGISEEIQLEVVGISTNGDYMDVPGESINYTSSDPDVVAVDANGKVTAGDLGAATITASAGGGVIDAVKDISVLDLMIRSFHAKLENKGPKVGDTTQILLDIADGAGNAITLDDLPGATVSYVSAAPGIATVSASGEVELIDKGFTNILVTLTYGPLVKKAVVNIGADDLPGGWNVSRYGNAAGRAFYDGGTYTVYGSGDNVWTADDFVFVYQNVAYAPDSDKVSISATVEAMYDTNNPMDAMVGLMIRAADTDNAYHMMLRTVPLGNVLVVYRAPTSMGGIYKNDPEDDYGVNYMSTPGVILPVEMKMELESGLITGYIKRGGEWVAIGAVGVPMGDEILVGFGVCPVSDEYSEMRGILSNVVVEVSSIYEAYTVTFESDGGTEVAPQIVQNGDLAAEPEIPLKGGYTFAGWYTEAAFENLYDFGAPVAGDITLYAKWEELVVAVAGIATTAKDFISITETAKNSRVWTLTFWVTVSYADGSIARVQYAINLDGNNANLDGEYKFAADHDLAGYTLVYDIKGNGKNIKAFSIK